MARKKKEPEEHPVFLWADFTIDFAKITDIELATLKMHIVIEGALRFLLASRLGIKEEKLLEELSFKVTSELALVGVENSHLIGGVRALSKARNSLAHSIRKSADIQEQLAIFVREMGYMSKQGAISWPDSPSKQLYVLKEAFDQATGAILELIEERERA